MVYDWSQDTIHFETYWKLRKLCRLLVYLNLFMEDLSWIAKVPELKILGIKS